MKKRSLNIIKLLSLFLLNLAYAMEKPQQNPQPAALSAAQGPVSRVRMTRGGQIASIETVPAPQAPAQPSYSEAFAPIPVPASSGASAGVLPVVESKRSSSPDAASMPMPHSNNPAQKQSSSRRFEFSNQSSNIVAVWIPKDQRSWLPITLAPEKDSGMVTPFEGQTIYIYTFSAFYVMTVQNNILKLIKEMPAGPGQIKPELIKSLPYPEALDILVIIDPSGAVDFAKRNR